MEKHKRTTNSSNWISWIYVLFTIVTFRDANCTSAKTVTLADNRNNVLESIFKETRKELFHQYSNKKFSLFADNYVITHPSRVTDNGRFISHQLTYFFKDDSDFKHFRKKRDTERDYSNEKNIYFDLKVDSSILRLNVSKNSLLFHPNFVIERLHKDQDQQKQNFESSSSSQASFRRGTAEDCHLRGHVVGFSDSAVAISTCDGLTGLIRLDDVDYFIEPLTPATLDVANYKPQPHKIYTASATESAKNETRRSRLKREVGRKSGNKTKFCAVADNKRRYRRELRRRKSWEARRLTHAKRQRRRRSISVEHWVELMVVADHEMVEFHGPDHIEKYVLTIVNIVSELFHDVSIGNSIHISLVRLIILDEKEESLEIGSHAEKTLNSFCRWAKRMNPQSDQHPNHHDVAVLLTRHNLCSNPNSSCETLGLAHVAGMCHPHRSCNVNQDLGLSLAFTVAHELGHNFAMHHDGQLNNCKPDDNYPRLMAPELTSSDIPMRWSSCSRRYITRFLDRNWGFCLLDPPSPDRDDFIQVKEFPGVLYDADHQCRLAFGPNSRQCVKKEDHMCARLWCLYKGTCRTRFHAAAPGTPCADGKWCYGGSCVDVQKAPSSVDGSWGPWTPYGRCSRTCGVGVSQSARYCNQPSPKNAGKYCLGERKRYRTCNIWRCPKKRNSVSFRSEQCAEFNKIPYKDQNYTWFPVESPIYPCELHCYTRDTEQPFADRFRDKVIDGTKCFSHGNDICVDGICKRLGCDMQIGSRATQDKCGVCRGNGSSCYEVNKLYNVSIGDEYVTIDLLPKGARHIRVEELAPSGNFLALKSPSNASEFYLNGDYMIQWDYQFHLAGTPFSYKRKNTTLDIITAEGPIDQDIVVVILYVEENPGVNISYIMPHNVTAVFQDQYPVFEWKIQAWSQCSRTCGEGIQTSLALCVERKAGIVEEEFCDEEKKPSDEKKTCSNLECDPEWSAAPWQSCSVTCGEELGFQKRAVLCIRSLSEDQQLVLNMTDCNETFQPEDMRSCSAENHLLCPMWKVFFWQNCSETCGDGYRNRSVKCVSYIINDVTSADDAIENTHEDSDLDKIDLRYELDREEKLFRGSEISRFVLLEKPQSPYENMKYQEEIEDKCNPSIKPEQSEPCRLKPCVQSQTSVSISGSGSGEGNVATNPADLLDVFVPKRNSTSAVHDLDFDVIDDPDLSTQSILNNGSVLNKEDYQDFLDLKVPSKPNANRSKNDSFSASSGDGSSTASNDYNFLPESTTNTSSTTTSPAITPEWMIGIWGQCSTTCGIGAKFRNVVCNVGTGRCDHLTLPAPAERCNLKPCARWQYANWTECSSKCGKGKKEKGVQCRDEHSGQLLPQFHCRSIPKLRRVTTSCYLRPCIPWRTSTWSRCNVSCGMGVQRRQVGCIKEGLCDPTKRPFTQRNCKLRSCTEWKAYHWGRCPVKCGFGIKRRVVQCVEKDTGAISRDCDPKLAPDRKKKCNRGPCRVTDFDFASCNADRLRSQFCAILKKWGKCIQPSLAIQCCKTCKTYISVRWETESLQSKLQQRHAKSV